jgi:hypothetical protein
MAFAEDLSTFLDVDGFAVTAQATTRFGEVVQLQVIFDNGYAAGLGGVMASTTPSILAQSSNVQDLAPGSSVTVLGSDWTVAEIQPDGTGMTLLLLEKAA